MEFSIESGTEVLHGTPDALRGLVSGLSEGWLDGDEGPDTWSPFQVVGHLTHIEESDWIDRTKVILEHGANRPFDPVDREAGFARFKGWSMAELLERFASVRASNLEELDALVAQAVDDPCHKTNAVPVTERELRHLYEELI